MHAASDGHGPGVTDGEGARGRGTVQLSRTWRPSSPLPTSSPPSCYETDPSDLAAARAVGFGEPLASLRGAAGSKVGLRRRSGGSEAQLGLVKGKARAMAAWTIQLITLVGVAIGAAASYLSTRLTDRSRWRREERMRWDTKRLECYTDFSAAIIQFINIIDRMAAGRGLPAVAEPMGTSGELPALSTASAEVTLRWAQLLILGSPQVARAAQEWRDETWVTESFARGLNTSGGEFEDARRRRRQARARFYAAVRADLGVTSGDVPAELGIRLPRTMSPSPLESRLPDSSP